MNDYGTKYIASQIEVTLGTDFTPLTSEMKMDKH